MKIARKISEIKEFLSLENKLKSIGFVPTMGALHKGHISLIEKSVKENSITVVSIFVNPTQFNNPDDLQKYPRTIEADIDLIKKVNADFIFIPSENEMYPEPDLRVFNFNGLDSVMEGQFREGHFNGVAQIVSKLFNIIQPNKAYFGKKDFQQLAIVKYLAKNYLPELNIEIIGCEIIRESDGLAMSSRNTRLSAEQRNAATLISKTLFKYQKQKSNLSVKQIKESVVNEINENPILNVEYFEIVNDDNLMPINEIIFGKTTACIAVFAGQVRLIDNINF